MNNTSLNSTNNDTIFCMFIFIYRLGLELHEGFGFVFGGDLYDKGPYDIRLTKMLCDLKESNPDRVWLLMGNRDINKLRLSSELCTPGELERLHDGEKSVVCCAFHPSLSLSPSLFYHVVNVFESKNTQQ